MFLFKKIISIFFYLLVSLTTVFYMSCSFAAQDNVTLFPLDHYDQTLSTWINPNDSAFDKDLLDFETQQRHMALFYEHYIGALSPWNKDHILQILQQSPQNNLKTTEQALINNFSNEGKQANEIGYGENFRPYNKTWIEKIRENIDLAQFDEMLYQAARRGIAVANLQVRALPTADPFFYHYTIAGEGYPFDLLQMSALWVGTPVYVLGETRDHAWVLVATADYVGWVKSDGIAQADEAFIAQWQQAAKNKLVAMTRTQTSILDTQGKFLFSAYVGTFFPASKTDSDVSGITIQVPVTDAAGHAIITNALLAEEDGVAMPLRATPHHFSMLMRTLLGRPYGWGGLYFYNDCSAELKNLLTPFGIWLPRHSSQQVSVGRMVDRTAASPAERLAYLVAHGKPFLTIVYIGGHVFLYLGHYPDPQHRDTMIALTYQNLWGLSPSPAVSRAVIGQSVLFPLLLQYQEDPHLMSLASKKYFQIAYLNQLPMVNFLLDDTAVSIKSLMYPEDVSNE